MEGLDEEFIELLGSWPSYATHHNLSTYLKIALDNIKNEKKIKEKVIPVIYQLQVTQYQLKASHLAKKCCQCIVMYSPG